MKTNHKLLIIMLLSLLAGCTQVREEEAESPQAADSLYSGSQFSEHVRTTEARTPEEEQAGFQLPEGFTIELYASEPDIGKPINLSFDAQGRLWVTQSHEYPFAAEPGKGGDRLSVLEDTDGDGKADKFVHYEDTLNIPIGILPIEKAAIVYSIPNVYLLEDTNDDGQAGESKVLLGPFGHKDTHGMINNIERAYDGWIYACHGFSNSSTVAGTDGDSIHMESGNTFRFRADGSHVEQLTFGQVNPFGQAWDEWGYRYTTDCHTSPIYQLIRGADYPHFGKKPEGIGFAPDAKPHGEESTALAGLVYYAARQFPKEYQQNFYIGDVVTCRVHRNSFKFQGSTPVAKAEPDLVKSADPWFRPVDIELGPDGALYVADFYNSIIGHYEVPLDHPKRDRLRGRIWRITYHDHKTNKEQKQNLAAASVEQLLTALHDDNQVIRLTAADQLVDRVGKQAVKPVSQLLSQKETEGTQYVHALWVLHRLGALSDEMITKAAKHTDPVVRVHTMRIIQESEDAAQTYKALACTALGDPNPHVQRVALEAVAQYPGMETLQEMLAHQEKIPASDSHWRYTARLRLRNLLREEKILQQVVANPWDEQDAATLADVMTGVNHTYAGTFLYDYVQSHQVPEEQLAGMMQHIARFVPQAQLNQVVRVAKQQAAEDMDAEFMMFAALQQGLAQRGMKATQPMIQWGGQLAQDIFTQYFPENPSSEAASSEAASSKAASLDTAALAAQRVKKLKLAVSLAGEYKLASLAPRIKASLQQPATDPAVKVAAAKALLQIEPGKNAPLVRDVLQDESQTVAFKRQMISMLGELPGPATRKVLAAVKNLPPDLQKDLAIALAVSPEGKDIIFQKVSQGEMLPRTLIEPKVEERILLNISQAHQAKFNKLTANLASVSEEKEQLIRQRLTAFAASDAAVDAGHAVFVQQCAPCHKIDQEGSMIGPQLTGIGNWGDQALATKILDPNRNISEAFRTYTIKTKDGNVMTGLYRREEGEVLVFANMAGQEFSVPKAEIAERKASPYTLMPDNFGERLSQQDFNALLSYLLNQQ